jgi:hypothetical protein
MIVLIWVVYFGAAVEGFFRPAVEREARLAGRSGR